MSSMGMPGCAAVLLCCCAAVPVCVCGGVCVCVCVYITMRE